MLRFKRWDFAASARHDRAGISGAVRGSRQTGRQDHVQTVGMIADPHQAEAILAEGRADWVAIGRAFLDNPRWSWHAADTLGAETGVPAAIPSQPADALAGRRACSPLSRNRTLRSAARVALFRVADGTELGPIRTMARGDHQTRPGESRSPARRQCRRHRRRSNRQCLAARRTKPRISTPPATALQPKHFGPHGRPGIRLGQIFALETRERCQRLRPITVTRRSSLVTGPSSWIDLSTRLIGGR